MKGRNGQKKPAASALLRAGLLACLLLVLFLTAACVEEAVPAEDEGGLTDRAIQELVKALGLREDELEIMPKDRYTEPVPGETVDIVLADGATTARRGVRVSGNEVRIIAAGTYRLKGSLTEGRIIVDMPKTEDVRLLFDGVSVHCSTAPPFYVQQADKVILSLMPGSDNFFSAAEETEDADGRKEDAVLLCDEDLVINGSGSLTVESEELNGIRSRDSLKIMGGSIHVRSGRSGLIGKDAVMIIDGTLRLRTLTDGIVSTNIEDAGRGFICISGGDIEIRCGRFGIQAADAFIMAGGRLALPDGEASIDCARKMLVAGEISGIGAVKEESSVDSSTAAPAETEPVNSEESASSSSEGTQEPTSVEPSSFTEESTAESSVPQESTSETAESSTEELINGYPADSFTGFSGGLKKRRGH